MAELLVSMSLRVGVERTVATASRVLGHDALADAAPLLQPLALTSATRRAVRHQHGLLDEQRTRIAEATGEQPAQPQVLLRVRSVSLRLPSAAERCDVSLISASQLRCSPGLYARGPAAGSARETGSAGPDVSAIRR